MLHKNENFKLNRSCVNEMKECLHMPRHTTDRGMIYVNTFSMDCYRYIYMTYRNLMLLSRTEQFSGMIIYTPYSRC